MPMTKSTLKTALPTMVPKPTVDRLNVPTNDVAHTKLIAVPCGADAYLMPVEPVGPPAPKITSAPIVLIRYLATPTPKDASARRVAALSKAWDEEEAQSSAEVAHWQGEAASWQRRTTEKMIYNSCQN